MGTGQVSGEASGQSVQDELKVFISYSRRDAEFVDRLQDALAARGITAHVDRQDIEKGEEWWARIQDLISGADTIVFVMSPDAVNSPVCRQEVAYASEMNKRFVPIVVRDVDGLDVPDELARLNYIFFIANSSVGASGEFDEAVDQLVHALETDIQWIREHTRVGMLAARWAAHSHPGDLLLRGVDLTRAEDWLASRPRKAPDPTNLHVTYITESRRAATKRQRFVIGLSTAAVVVALVLAALAYWQRGIALENEALAKTERDRALVGQSLFLTKTGDEHLSAGDPQSAILLNLEALPDEASGVARPLVAEAEAGLYLALSRSGTSQALAVTHSKSEIVFSPDGRYIGVTPAGFTDYGDVAARVYDLKTAAHVFTIPGRVVAVEFSADQSAIIALVDGQTIEGPVHIEVYSWPERKLRLRFEVGLRSPDSLAVSRDGKLVAAAGYAGAIGLWNLHDGSKLAEATAHDGETIPDLEFSPDGKRLASAGFNSSAMLWAVPTLEPIAKLICNKEHVQQVHFNEDGRRLTTRCLGMAALWHGETGGKITDLGDERTKDSIRKVWFEQAGEVEVVVTASGNGTLTWDPPNRRHALQDRFAWCDDKFPQWRLLHQECRYGHRGGRHREAFAPRHRVLCGRRRSASDAGPQAVDCRHRAEPIDGAQARIAGDVFL